MKRLLALLACLVPLLAAAASWQELTYDQLERSLGNRVGPFGEKGVYSLTNVFSIQSTFGTSFRRDIETTSGTGAIALDGAYIELTSGTTTGSSATLETVDRGQYQPGKAAEAGIALFMVTPPDSGTEKIEWGLGDGDNGIFWRYHDSNSDGSFELCVVYERSSTENETCRSDFNGDDLTRFDPVAAGAIYVVRFNWYGVGGAEFIAYQTSGRVKNTLREFVLHRHAPADGQAVVDPNLPLFATVDNGDGTTNVEAEVGGRRYDIQGNFRPPERLSGDIRTGQTVTASGSPRTPLICARRESPFPEAGRQNSVNAYVEGFDILSDQDMVVLFVAVDDLADLTGESFGTPTDHVDGNTAIETDTSATAITNFEFADGPWLISGGDTPSRSGLGSTRGRQIPLSGTNPTCLVGYVPGGTDATVASSLRLREEW